jgi:hypothetical protein
MHETGGTGKRMREQFRMGLRWQPLPPPEFPARPRAHLARRPDETTDKRGAPITATCRKMRGAGERWPDSFNGCPLTTGCRNRHPVPRNNNGRWLTDSRSFEGFKPQSRRRPVSQTPAPPFANGPQSCTLLVCISRHRQVDGKSSTAPEHTAPKRGYFFFLAATLRLAGAFFFAADFAFVAFFTILPS